MSREVHSPWTKLLVVAFLAILATSLLIPWFTLESTTGQTVAPGLGDGNESTAERRELRIHPDAVRGDYNATNRSAVEDASRALGRLVFGALGAGGLALVAELAGGSRTWGRYAVLSLLAVAALAALAALIWTWFYVPPTLKGDGVTGPFTSGRQGMTFIRSTIDWGWVVGAAALPACLAALGFRYSAGAFDLHVMETYHVPDAAPNRPAAPPAHRPPPKP